MQRRSALHPAFRILPGGLGGRDLVDDDAMVRPILSSMLQLSGYEVIEASNDADGLQRFQQHPADLVLCDLLMPGTNSLEMTRAFDLDSLAIPIVAMSGSSQHCDTDLLAFALVMGAVAILQKPFSFAVLQAAIETALERPPSRTIKGG